MRDKQARDEIKKLREEIREIKYIVNSFIGIGECALSFKDTLILLMNRLGLRFQYIPEVPAKIIIVENEKDESSKQNQKD
jgi:hypothetical protein